jgi:hypothetical protein
MIHKYIMKRNSTWIVRDPRNKLRACGTYNEMVEWLCARKDTDKSIYNGDWSVISTRYEVDQPPANSKYHGKHAKKHFDKLMKKLDKR